MATVTQTPAVLNPMNRGGKWILTQAPTAPPVETRAAWEVEVEGNKISEGSELTTGGGDEIVIDPREDLIGYMRMELPGLTVRSVYNIEDQIIAEATLKYGTVVIDSTNEPVVKTVTVASTSGPFDFINAMIHPLSGDILNTTASAWLSYHPDTVYTHPWSYSWICLYGSSGINVTYWKCDGTSGTFSMSAPFVASAIPTGPANLNLDDDVKYYELEFVAMGRTIGFVVECGAKEEETGTIVFLEPIGGISAHALTQVAYSGSASSQSAEYHFEPDSAYATWSQYGGITTLRKSARPTMSGTIRVKPTKQYLNFVAGMLGSPLAFIQTVDNAGNTIFVKANIISASIGQPAPDGFATLQMSAAFAQTIEGQRSVY
jgi:hypothetical protein